VQKAKIRSRTPAGLKTRLHTPTRSLEALRREGMGDLGVLSRMLMKYR
jgi:hypothetical protein